MVLVCLVDLCVVAFYDFVTTWLRASRCQLRKINR